ncbi:CRISPR-associated endonuclease/helicase Cas3 [Melghiribacillus thermohalophilus]|uniref:CRISPR-associated endonuclease/helicase Cas3 n=1 Tax=Melghiribacillus thermohalophilus TaxID=1324956 RepID=A0A4R3MZB7_9BACI|nr:CRISPR-associated helicase Cas3' [Melghiribacillus thermohalophilus]TCT21774.1 CRISPR-associated endonuclease/helicase Cas3 [Melghiribacillus thermohalophilus]
MGYIAHIRNEDHAIQSVEEHLEEVSKLAAKFGEKIGVKHLALLAGILHDMGKYSDSFKEYITSAVFDPDNAPPRGSVDHSTAGGRYVFNLAHHENDQASKMIGEILGNIIISHHMGLQDFIDPDHNSPFLKRICDKEIEDYKDITNRLETFIGREKIEQFLDKSKSELIEVLQKNAKSTDKAFLTLSFLTKFIFSALIDADRTDTQMFEENNYKNITQNNIPLFKNYYKKLIRHLNLLNKNNDVNSKINTLRANMSDQCDKFAEKPTGIYTLSIPTGGGKTLSSLRYALKHAIKYEKERIIYVVPYTTIIEQNANEVKTILQDEDHILEHHSNVVQDTDQRNYTEHKSIGLAKDNWDSPIIFTTMVQFLNNFYSKGTRNIRRLHSLANAVIIFDEVQSVPVHCVSLFNEAINFLKNVCGTTILLCTATQPALDFVKNKIDQIDDEIIQNMGEVRQSFKRVALFDKTSSQGWSTEELSEFILKNIGKEDSILCILNTRKVVKKLYAQLKKQLNTNEYSIYHLSTSMCPAHRKEILNEIKNKLDNKEKVICVSTQLIEAGVDISFSCVIRSLSGVDSIAQAAGRCNRHGELKTGNVYIIKHKEEHLNHLKSIKIGSEITYKMILEKGSGNSLDHLMSYESISLYFKQFYHELERELDYMIPELNSSIYQLLSINQKFRENYDRKHNQYPLILNTSFNTAAKYFKVIDKHATSVIVPYGKGEDIITDLNGELTIQDVSVLLKRAQQYTIDIFEHEKNELIKSGDLIPLQDGQFLVLRQSAYDKNFGLNIEGNGEMESLFI